MENKIFNAIQKGLSNVLIFDDNDSAISYQKSNINNETEFPKVSLNVLHNIFKDCPEDIFRYNTKDCLSLILDNNQEISLHEYKSSDKLVFVKISNNILKETGNEIIIACNNNHYISVNELKWITVNKSLLMGPINRVTNDFKGYAECQEILDIVKNKLDNVSVPIIEYCDNLKSPLPNYKGYLPAIGQINFILEYLDIVNYIFRYMGFYTINLNKGKWCSSSERFDSCEDIWCINNKALTFYSKTAQSYAILPLFKQIN